jgi:hypothetical protein
LTSSSSMPRNETGPVIIDPTDRLVLHIDRRTDDLVRYELHNETTGEPLLYGELPASMRDYAAGNALIVMETRAARVARLAWQAARRTGA